MMQIFAATDLISHTYKHKKTHKQHTLGKYTDTPTKNIY